MFKAKSTKKALLASALSLIVCFTMLLGTTFAWFTDSVESGRNTIVAGNLDVELEYTLDGENWAPVDENTVIFDENDLWEPGHTVVAGFRVKNVGTLALKYALSTNVIEEKEGTNVAGETFKLSDYLEVYSVDAMEANNFVADIMTSLVFGSRASATGNGTAMAKGDFNINLASDDNLVPAEEHITFIAITMPEEVGNEANYKTGTEAPFVAFGINLYATQVPHEEDSFNNQYDVAATWVGTIPASLEDTTLVIEPTPGEQTGTITVNSPEDLVYLNKLAKEWVSLYSNGQGTNVGSYRENVGGKGTAYYYHWSWAIELATDLDMNNIPMDSVDISYWDDFEGNGHTISNVILKDGQDGLFINGSKAVNNLTVKNITVNAPAENTVGAVSGNGSMTNVHVENAIVNGGKYVGGICGKGSSFVNCSIKNSTVTGNDKTVGGLVGYSVGDPNPATVTGNLVENVTVIGAYNVGGLLGQAQNETVDGNTVKDVRLTSNASVPAGDATEVRTGAVVARNYNATVGTNTATNVTETLPATPETIQDEINAAASGATIYLAPAKFHTAINMKSGITLVGAKGTVVDCINLNGTENVTLKEITFDAAGAQEAYDGSGTRRAYANIYGASKGANIGARNVVIDGCIFEGKFVNAGAAIAFADRSRKTGGSGNVTVKNCAFNTENANYDVYGYYTGAKGMTFTFENNTFASECRGPSIYLGRLATSEAIVVKRNNFKTTDSLENSVYIQAHSATYTPTLDAADNTFGV